MSSQLYLSSQKQMVKFKPRLTAQHNQAGIGVAFSLALLSYIHKRRRRGGLI